MAASSTPMAIELGLLHRADGSARFSQGNTEILTSVYGPVEVKQRSEKIDCATIECNFQVKSGIPGCAERQIEELIVNTIDHCIITNLHPRSAISMTNQVIQNNGSLLSCAINSTIAAIINSGLPMNYMVAAVTIALDNDGEMQFYPTSKIEEEAAALMTFAFENLKGGLILSEAKGTFSKDEFLNCYDAAKTTADDIFKLQRDSISNLYSKGEGQPT